MTAIDEAAIRADERKKIATWLRWTTTLRPASGMMTVIDSHIAFLAGEIERGEYRGGER